jgi:hypothetical protein
VDVCPVRVVYEHVEGLGVITEAIFRAFWSTAAVLDTLIPPIPWPDFFGTYAEFWNSININNDLTGFFVFVHPLTYDVVLLSITLRVTKAIVNRLRSMLSLATGGGVEAV